MHHLFVENLGLQDVNGELVEGLLYDLPRRFIVFAEDQDNVRVEHDHGVDAIVAKDQVVVRNRFQVLVHLRNVLFLLVVRDYLLKPMQDRDVAVDQRLTQLLVQFPLVFIFPEFERHLRRDSELIEHFGQEREE